MRERLLVFGSHRGLVGVLTEPDPAARAIDAPALLLANVGLNHRVGPHRIWVDLARSAARAGYPVLRFDLAGMGDSAPRRDTRSDLERAVVDVREALDALETEKVARRFVLAGICSGVDSAHTVAREDPRVVGAVFVDGYVYRTRSDVLVRSLRALDPYRWKRRVAPALRSLLARTPRRASERAPEIYTRSYPPQEQFRADLSSMVARDVSLLFVYTSGASSFLWKRQFWRMSGLRPSRQVQLEHWVRADHVFSSVLQRRSLVDRITSWVSHRFPGEPVRAQRRGAA